MFSSCIYVSFVNKYIENGWMSFFYFTESREAASPSKSKPSIKVSDSKQSASNDDSRPPGTPFTNEASSSSIPDRDGPMLKKEDSIPVGVANVVCKKDQFDDISSRVVSEVKVMARTSIFDVSKSNFVSTAEDDHRPIPTFRPLKTCCGLSAFDPYIYEGDRALNVPFIKISPGVKEIHKAAFSYNDHIEQLFIPKTVTRIGEGALKQCLNLKHVIYEERSSPLHIGKYAFYRSMQIEEMTFPASLEILGFGAFLGCEGLKKVTFSSNMTTPKNVILENGTFSGCSSLTIVEGMNAISSIEQNAFFYNCSSLESININQSADIHGKAFESCPARINRI
jgi:hypothetical protein